MFKKISFILIILIFIFGICICIYPSISSYLNEKNCSSVISNTVNIEKQLDKTMLEQEKEKVNAYNKSLADNHIVLTDPFDPNAFPITDGDYNDLLSVTDIMAYIEIPKINVSLPIKHGTNEITLQNYIGHLENTSLPIGGKSTHAVLSGHTGLPTQKLFSDLDKMQLGDIFYINVLDEKLAYKVDQIKIVEPEDSSDLLIEKNKDYVTLVTCTPYGKNTKRLLVRASRTELDTAIQKENEIEQNTSYINKLLNKYGISIRELIVFASIVILTIAFIIILIIFKVKKIRRLKYAKQNT